MGLLHILRRFLTRPGSTRLDASLRADFSWILSGNVIYSACQWAILITLAKLGTPGQVGEYALAVAVTSPVILFANLQLRAVLASDVRDQYSFRQYLGFRLASLGAAMFIMVVFLPVMARSWQVAAMVVVVGAAQVLESLSDTYYGLMQKNERMDRISRSLMVKGPISLLGLALGMYLGGSVLWAAAGLAMGRLTVLLAYESRLSAFVPRSEYSVQFGRPEWNLSMMKTLLLKSAPLGVISTLISLNNNIPRYFIEADLSKRELGIFSAMASLLSSGTLVMSALGAAAFLPMAKAHARNDEATFRALVFRLMMVGGLLGVAGVAGAWIAGGPILAHLFRPEYGRNTDVLIWLMLAGAVAYVASGQGQALTAIRSLKPQIPLLACTGAATMAGSFWLVPKHGLAGAAEACLIGTLVQLAGGSLILYQLHRATRATPKKDVKVYSLTSAGASS